jgi:hypothetical protein
MRTASGSDQTRRPLVSFLVAALVVALILPSVRSARVSAQEAAEPALPDLAAMTLLPADLPEPGFLLEGGRRVSLEDEAAGAAAYRGQTATPEAATGLSEALTAAGWRVRYRTSLALPSADNPDLVAIRVISYATFYDTPEGAAAGFALLEDESAIPTAEDVSPGRVFADQAEITRDSGLVGGLDQAYRSLDLTFRRGHLTAGVLIYDNLDREPDQTVLEDLGDLLLARIEEVLDGRGPELGNRVVRLGEYDENGVRITGIDFNDETYERRAGVTIPYAGESAERLAAREAHYGGATDVYSVYQALVLLDGISNDDPYYVARLYQFPDETAASQWLIGLPERLPQESAGYVEAHAVPEAPAFGDESVTIGYDFQPIVTITTRGTLIAVRIGAIVARVQVDSWYEADPVGIRALMERQVACLNGGACPANTPVPQELLVPGPAPAIPNPIDPV